MIKKIIIVLTSLLIFGTVLTGVAFFLDDEDTQTIGSVQTKEIKLDEFNNLVVDAISADIIIENGDNFSISYQLHHREKIEKAEVVDGTFYFVTGIDKRIGRRFKLDNEEHIIYITVPNTIDLNNINLSTVSGDIEIDERAIGKASLNSVSGDISLTGVTAEQVDCEVVSGDIDIIKSNIIESTASGKSADISFEGSFEYVDIDTVSGDCELTTDTIKDIEINNISGDIEVITPVTGISAKSYGKINYCGQNQGFEFNLPNDNSMLTINSSSGKIDIQTK